MIFACLGKTSVESEGIAKAFSQSFNQILLVLLSPLLAIISS